MARGTLNSEQRKRVKALCAFIGVSESHARMILESNDWDVESAADDFFENPTPSPRSAAVPVRQVSKVDREKINTWFDTYADEEEPNCIYDEGILAFCADIAIDSQDIVILILSWKMKAEIMCRFSREEFQCGMNAIQVDSSTALISKLDRLRSSLDEDPSAFKSFYEFCFEFSKEEGQKSLSLDVAMAIWDIVLVSRFDKMVDWCEFLSSSSSHHPKGITRDTWCLLLDFMQLVEHDYGSYDEASAWPVLVDEFMEWQEAKQANGGK